MSLINEYRATKEAIKELQERLESLSQDNRLQEELKFEESLRTLMGEYDKSLRDIIGILDPDRLKVTRAPVRTASATDARRMRKTKRYVNPSTKEVIETKGGNHKILKEWKQQWGADIVETWVTILD